MTDREFEILFREQFKPLCNLAYTVVKDIDVSKDVVQQVFLNYWQIRERTTIKGSIKGYLYRAVINASLSHLNRSKRFTTIETNSNESIVEEHNENENDREIQEVHRVINDLPPVCKKVFMLSRFSNLTNKEIADELGVSVKAVEKHNTKALKTLRDKLRHLVSDKTIVLALIYFLKNFFILYVGFLVKTMSLLKD